MAMPYKDRDVEIRFDFVDHKLVIETSDNQTRVLDLKPQSVAEFYGKFMAALAELGVNIKIWTTPVELPGHGLGRADTGVQGLLLEDDLEAALAGVEQLLAFEARKRGVERALLDGERVSRDLRDSQ